MGILSNAKEVTELVKALGNTELYRKIVELEGEILDLSRENRTLQEDNVELRRIVELKEALAFDEPVYVMEGDRTPFCAQCWEAESKAIHLKNLRNDGRFICTNCDSHYHR